MTQLESDLQALRESDLPLKAKRKLFAALKRQPGFELGTQLESEVQAWRASASVRRKVADRYAESEAKWDRIFNEKFADPSYYTDPLLPWSRSCLTGF